MFKKTFCSLLLICILLPAELRGMEPPNENNVPHVRRGGGPLQENRDEQPDGESLLSKAKRQLVEPALMAALILVPSIKCCQVLFNVDELSPFIAGAVIGCFSCLSLRLCGEGDVIEGYRRVKEYVVDLPFYFISQGPRGVLALFLLLLPLLPSLPGGD